MKMEKKLRVTDDVKAMLMAKMIVSGYDVDNDQFEVTNDSVIVDAKDLSQQRYLLANGFEHR